ncbi:SMP-30/gluconolactonase/LRE family protein [Allorhizobium taibaishanense]|uniref:Gluconolaconase n=1 Tax=Allorhizobium taibaishanense TaxID=887144 RepID=A0A1Q9AAB1_9HYPH|nr:SMP-30/gluconolactonase/LRE family protein [Allorhizobium taibaishanense]MBB4006942.1 sugar lactone lactonase YvrE [Allorhizobium taibaishanense]OLP51772.1 gluconolaconase [Allorhizobium taibaishanense]
METAYSGTILVENRLTLGEGPTYDPSTDTAWWFDILGKGLIEHRFATGETITHALPVMGSVLAKIDADRQMLATEKGIFIREVSTGALTLLTELEPERPGNRSNDGRVHQSGALWVGTMGKTAADGAGAIYHVAGKTVTRLYDGISIPNSICFSPDGSLAYFVDTRVNQMMKVSVDPATGLPTGTPSLHIDGRERKGGIDGSVCDAEGDIWNACWGVGAVDHYNKDGKHLARYRLPAAQTTCPAFIGAKADRLLVTTATEGLDAEGLAADPEGGKIFLLDVTVNGRHEPSFRL